MTSGWTTVRGRVTRQMVIAYAVLLGAAAVCLGVVASLHDLQKDLTGRLSQATILLLRSDKAHSQVITGARLAGWVVFALLGAAYVLAAGLLALGWRTLNGGGGEEKAAAARADAQAARAQTDALLTQVDSHKADADAAKREAATLLGLLGDAEGKRKRAEGDRDGAIRAISRVVHRLYNVDRPRWRFKSVDGRYLVDADGTTSVELAYGIVAGPAATQVWRYKITADDSSDPVSGLDAIEFKLEQMDPAPEQEITYLLYKDDPRHKEIAVFFLPELQPGEERSLKVSYRWPGMTRDLLTKNVSEFGHRFVSCDPADRLDVSYTYLFARDLHPLTCERWRAKIDGDALTQVSEAHMKGWRYEARDVLAEGREIYFAIRRAA